MENRTINIKVSEIADLINLACEITKAKNLRGHIASSKRFDKKLKELGITEEESNLMIG